MWLAGWGQSEYKCDWVAAGEKCGLQEEGQQQREQGTWRDAPQTNGFHPASEQQFSRIFHEVGEKDRYIMGEVCAQLSSNKSESFRERHGVGSMQPTRPGDPIVIGHLPGIENGQGPYPSVQPTYPLPKDLENPRCGWCRGTHRRTAASTRLGRQLPARVTPASLAMESLVTLLAAALPPPLTW
ncbi:hypothetical protein C8R44DRAFT_741194 [Mycena epipterygia]|nr:hypothetical protein C8R44DRAFT_741194 [Mycena epipterygia]